MSTAKARAVQVPGAQLAPQTLAEVLTEDDVSTIKAVMEPNASADVDDEVAALRAELAATKAKLAKKEAARVVAPVVPLKAGGAQQTEKGWIVPETFGSPAAKKA